MVVSTRKVNKRAVSWVALWAALAAAGCTEIGDEKFYDPVIDAAATPAIDAAPGPEADAAAADAVGAD